MKLPAFSTESWQRGYSADAEQTNRMLFAKAKQHSICLALLVFLPIRQISFDALVP